jgi:prolyl 4-hydroxylase
MSEWDRPQGPRVLTVFMYLNDVEEGGGTHFGRLGLTVMPKRGKVLIWPSVLDDDPEEWDERTHHEALEVTKVRVTETLCRYHLIARHLTIALTHVLQGIKYGTNAWIHLRDIKTQMDNGCV